MVELEWTRIRARSSESGLPEHHATHLGREYVIRSRPYGSAGARSFQGYRDGVRIPLCFSSRLKDCQKYITDQIDRESTQPATPSPVRPSEVEHRG